VFLLRSPKRRGQLGHRRTLLGDRESIKKGKIPPDMFDISKKYGLLNMQKCAWQQLPHVQQSTNGENNELQ